MVAIAAMNMQSIACNMCGCSSSNQYLGLLPQNNNNLIGMQYIYRSFSTNHPEEGGITMPGLSSERYHTFQLMGKVNVSKKLQLLAFVPVVYNIQGQDNMANTSINGLGDISVLANYKIIERNGCSWQQKLLAGGGIKLPTGKYDPNSVTTEEGLPNMQPGTHSWDFIANANYSVKYHATGLNIDVSYMATTVNKESYKFGNRLSSGASLFYEWKKKNVSILPLAGMRYDFAAKDYENYRERISDEDGGGWQLYASQGLQAYYKNICMYTMCYEPISQHYASDLVNTKFRLETGVVLQIK